MPNESSNRGASAPDPSRDEFLTLFHALSPERQALWMEEMRKTVAGEESVYTMAKTGEALLEGVVDLHHALRNDALATAGAPPTDQPASATDPVPGHRHFLANSVLERLTMKQLDSLYETFDVMVEVLLGLEQQPRFTRRAGDLLNAAGEIVDELLTHLQDCRSLVVAVADEREPTEPKEARDRAWLLLKSGAREGDELPNFSALAAALVARQSAVDWQSGRGASA